MGKQYPYAPSAVFLSKTEKNFYMHMKVKNKLVSHMIKENEFVELQDLDVPVYDLSKVIASNY